MSKTKDSVVLKKVLDFLIDRNRPFNANDILNDLQIDSSKTVIIKSLDGLVKDNKVKEKTYGKQKVYYVNQDIFGDSKNEDLQTMDCQINELSNTLTSLEKQIKNSENILGDLNKSLTTEMAEEELKDVKKEVSVLKDKLTGMESKSVSIDPKEIKTLTAKKETCLKQYQRRKRIANNIIDAILEGYPKSKKQLLEDLGVELDTDRII